MEKSRIRDPGLKSRIRNTGFLSVLRIRNILVLIRIRRSHASDLNTILSAFLLFEGIFTSLFKDKKVKRVTK